MPLLPQKITKDHPLVQYELGEGHNFTYLLLDWSSVPRRAAIIDPQLTITSILDQLKENRFELGSVFLSHGHSDHTSGLKTLLREFPDISIHLHAADAHFLSKLHSIKMQDEEVLSIGSLQLKILHTPGHTAGSCCFLLQGANAMPKDYLFTGDTVFIGNCGRTDLPSGSNAELFASLQRLRKLPAQTVILPGHRYSPEFESTLAQEIASSPPFLCKNLTEFEALP